MNPLTSRPPPAQAAREAAELTEGRIAGSTHIPLGRLPARVFELDRPAR